MQRKNLAHSATKSGATLPTLLGNTSGKYSTPTWKAPPAVLEMDALDVPERVLVEPSGAAYRESHGCGHLEALDRKKETGKGQADVPVPVPPSPPSPSPGSVADAALTKSQRLLEELEALGLCDETGAIAVQAVDDLQYGGSKPWNAEAAARLIEQTQDWKTTGAPAELIQILADMWFHIKELRAKQEQPVAARDEEVLGVRKNSFTSLGSSVSTSVLDTVTQSPCCLRSCGSSYLSMASSEVATNTIKHVPQRTVRCVGHPPEQRAVPLVCPSSPLSSRRTLYASPHVAVTSSGAARHNCACWAPSPTWFVPSVPHHGSQRVAVTTTTTTTTVYTIQSKNV